MSDVEVPHCGVRESSRRVSLPPSSKFLNIAPRKEYREATASMSTMSLAQSLPSELLEHVFKAVVDEERAEQLRRFDSGSIEIRRIGDPDIAAYKPRIEREFVGSSAVIHPCALVCRRWHL